VRADSFPNIQPVVPRGEDMPTGWVRFHMLRGLADDNEIVTFGFFDGTLEDLERGQQGADYEERRRAIEPLVDVVIANGVYEIVETWTTDGATGGTGR
jgi:hypothetical protein